MPKPTQEKIITYREVRGPYGFCSNFAPYPIELKGKVWPTVEHYFQAQKFEGTKYEETIRQFSYPRQAKTSGNDRSKPLRSDWEDVKISIMYTAVKAKFDQHPEIKQKLLETGDAILVEDAPWDPFWGSGENFTGQNVLGLILMHIRSKYRSEATMYVLDTSYACGAIFVKSDIIVDTCPIYSWMVDKDLSYVIEYLRSKGQLIDYKIVKQ